MRTGNYSFDLIFLILTISLFTACDKFDLDFTTESKFNLDESSHELEIKTKQDDAIITHVVLNGESIGLSCTGCEGVKTFENIKVNYSKGDIKEIEGEWFNVKVSPPYTFNVSISENHDNKERELIIGMIWKSAIRFIEIHQKEGSKNVNSRYTSFSEAKEISDLFMRWNDRDKNTTRSVFDMEIKESSIIKSNDKALMYVFNYNDGFTVIGASKGMYPILAYSETGSFNGNAEIPGVSIWLDFMKEEIENSLINTRSNS